MEIQKYSDKSIVVKGDGIYDFLAELEEKGGLYNNKLNSQNGKFSGVIFSLRREKSVEDFVKSATLEDKLVQKIQKYLETLDDNAKNAFKKRVEQL